MYASKRWAHHFVDALECVNCRRQKARVLYRFDGSLVKSEDLTIDQLRAMISIIDVWCEYCDVKLTAKVRSRGRLQAKEEAAKLADVRSQASTASYYDEVKDEEGNFHQRRNLLT